MKWTNSDGILTRKALGLILVAEIVGVAGVLYLLYVLTEEAL